MVVKAVKVIGEAVLKVKFSVDLVDITEAEFEALSERKQDELIDSAIDWSNETRNAEVDEFDVWEYREWDKEK